MASKRLQTVEKFLSHFASMDENILESVLAEDYIHYYAPQSLPHEPFDKRALINFVTYIKRIIKEYPMTIKESIDSESRKAVTVWTTARASFHDELKDDSMPPEDWVHHGEYMFLFYLNEDGDKIVKTIEFIDSKATMEKLLVIVTKASKKLESS